MLIYLSTLSGINSMSLHDLSVCPACKSKPEDYYFGGIIITCSKTGCGVSTGNKKNMIDAIEEWEKVCKIFPKPIPDDEGLELL